MGKQGKAITGSITPDTPWRTVGDVPYRVWRNAILDAGGPEPLASSDSWQAAMPHSAILLNKLRAESSFATRKNRNDPILTKNPFSLRRYNADGTIDSVNEDNPNGYLHFAMWEDGVRACRLRISDANAFADQTHGARNPYPATVTIADLITAFSPPEYNDTARIIRESVAYLNSIVSSETEAAVEPEGDDGMAVTFGRVPKPAMVEMIVSKPAHTGSAYGYDYCPPRKPVGLVHHETQGRGTGQWYHDFFSCPNGERCRNALVDFLIDKAGTIFLFNDPFGTRAGWANGGGVGSPGGLEGDGPAFYAKFGASGINQRLVSIEYVKTTDENFTDAQVQAGGALAAWIHDRDGQRWDEHPFTSKYGLVTSFLHFEFGTTNCGKGELDDITRVQAVTKGIMRKWQDGGKDDPVDPDVPPLPEPEIPGGLTLAQATERFGKATRHNKDGTVQVDRFGFDPQGPISLSWAHRAAAEKVWPEIEDWYVLEDSGETFQIVTFANDWRLMQVAERQGWQWIAFTAVTA